MWLDQECYIGAWCCSAFDSDRAVRTVARRSWDGILSSSNGIELALYAESILAFVHSLIFSPPSSSSESEDPTPLLTSSLLTLTYLLLSPSLPELRPSFLSSPTIWSLLDPGAQPSSAVRRAVYELLGAIVEREGQGNELLGGGGVGVVARWVLRYCWNEEEGWAGVVGFLRR